MDDVRIPGEPTPAPTTLIKNLTILASGLAVATIVVNLILQMASVLRKPKMRPDQRDRIMTAGLALFVLRQMPGLIRQVRLFASQIRGEPFTGR